MVFSTAADSKFEVKRMRDRHGVPSIRKFQMAMSVGARRPIDQLVWRFA